MKKIRNYEFIGKVIDKEIKDGHIAGAQISVIRHGEEIYRSCMGYADTEKKKITKKDTIYRLFSMSKLITSVSAMILYERGELDFLKPLSYYLPEFSDMEILDENGKRKATKEILMRDVMSMTAGIVYPDASFPAGSQMQKAYEFLYNEWQNGRELSTEETVKLIAKQPLEFEPGSRWRYSACADVCGRVVEKVSEMKFSEFLKKEIFEPLNMPDTDFYVPKKKQPRFSEMYDFRDGKLVKAGSNFLGLGDYIKKPGFESGGAGIVTTVDDYARFACMLAAGGEYAPDGSFVKRGAKGNKKLLAGKTVEFMTANQLTDEEMKYYNWDQLRGYGYGNYFRTMISLQQAQSNGSLGEFGWDGYMGDYVAIDPKEELVILYMQQKFGGCDNSMIRKIRNIIYSGIQE